MTDAAANSLTLPGSRRQLPQIQWLRGLAATMVMLFHSAAYRGILFHDDSLGAYFGPSLGYFGVALFFAISGYLMSIDIRAKPPVTFLAHRIVRIYPAYILATILFYILTEAFGRHFPYDPNALSLMPVPGLLPYLHIEWTLMFEIAFYMALFGISFAGQTANYPRIALAWLVVMMVVSATSPDNGTRSLMPIYQLLTVSTSVPISGGLLLTYLQHKRVPRLLLLALAVSPWLLPQLHAFSYDAMRWVAGSSAVFTVWLAVSLPEHSKLLRPGRVSRVLSRWGDDSYALYLCHVEVIILVYGRMADQPVWLAWAVAMVLAAGTAIVLGPCDLALYAWLKRLLRTGNPAGLKVIVLGYAAIYAVVCTYGAEQYFMRDRNLRIGNELALQLKQSGFVEDAASAEIASSKSGFHAVTGLVGHLDMTRWDSESRRLFVDIWAYNGRSRWQAIHVALFRNGKLLGVDAPSYVRKDVSASLGLRHRTKTGMHFEEPEDVCDPHPVVAILFTRDKGYRVLPSGAGPISCPASAGQRTP